MNVLCGEKYQVWRVVRHSADTWESGPPHLHTGSCSQPTNPAVAVPACSFSKGDGSNHGQCDQQPGREVAGELPLRLHRTERSKVVEKISPICVTIYRGKHCCCKRYHLYLLYHPSPLIPIRQKTSQSKHPKISKKAALCLFLIKCFPKKVVAVLTVPQNCKTFLCWTILSQFPLVSFPSFHFTKYIFALYIPLTVHLFLFTSI